MFGISVIANISAMFVQCVAKKGACHGGSYFFSSRYKWLV
jgi:hypothetical protein